MREEFAYVRHDCDDRTPCTTRIAQQEYNSRTLTRIIIIIERFISYPTMFSSLTINPTMESLGVHRHRGPISYIIVWTLNVHIVCFPYFTF